MVRDSAIVTMVDYSLFQSKILCLLSNHVVSDAGWSFQLFITSVNSISWKCVTPMFLHDCRRLLDSSKNKKRRTI